MPRTTLYNQRKRAAETETSSTETASKWKYQRSTTFNICRQCHLPKTKTCGHSRHVGRYGLETFCPSVEGKRYPSVDAWLQERRRDNPKKRKKLFYMTEFLVLSMIFVLQITLYPKQLCARYCLQDTTTKMSYGRESPRREFTPGVVLGREFHSGTK